MRFGPVPADESEGAILAHSVPVAGRTLRKGRRLTAEDAAALAAAGHGSVVAARLEPGDVAEDEAATRIAHAASGEGASRAAAFTGRVNLFSQVHGIVIVDRERLDRLNLVSEAVTIASLPPFATVVPRDMVATVKIIPFAAPEAAVAECAAIAAAGGPLLRVAAFRRHEAALIQTRLPGTRESVLDKTVTATEARLAALGSALGREDRCAHETAALADAIAAALADGMGPILVAGASAITDRRDVIPSAIEACGGTVEHFGMPVDPGNLLLLGRVGAVPVMGLPGCARSPRLNGFDWVLERLLAGIPVGREEIMRMGAGGLLAEIPTRPAPRAASDDAQRSAAPPRAPRIAGLLLAAGRSSRMGAVNKLTTDFAGMPIVRRAAGNLVAAGLEPLVAVLGHQRDAVAAALDGLPVATVDNPDYAGGLSTSLRRGLAALPLDVDGALVCLGDMPRVAPEIMRRLVAAFSPVEGREIIVPVHRGKRGNPVLWSRRFFAEMAGVAGDTGARHLLGVHSQAVVEIDVEEDGILVDIDTPDALREALAAAAAE